MGREGGVLIPQPECRPPAFPVTFTLLYHSFVSSRFMHTASPKSHLGKALDGYIIAGLEIKSINGSGRSSLAFTGCHKNGSV